MSIKEWKKNFRSFGLDERLIEAYTQYIEKLYQGDVPVIFDFKHLSLLLGKSPAYLASVLNSTSHHYRLFKIPKRRGGLRTIAVPYPALMECQRWINEHILKKIVIHPTAHGFASKKSILTNARIHIGQEHFLKIDLVDFFPSIKINRLIGIFSKLGYTNKVSYYLASLCSLDGQLPQGAPTSPSLSNIVARKLDTRLFAFAKSQKFRYTRYADDLAFSGDQINPNHLRYISSIIEDEGFAVNLSKTLLQRSAGRRIITGISIAEEVPKLPSTYKRKLRQELYFVLKHGIESHVTKKKIKNRNYKLVLIGKLRYWLNVEPDNLYALKALESLSGQKL